MKPNTARRPSTLLRLLTATAAAVLALALAGCGAGTAGGEASDGGGGTTGDNSADNSASDDGDATFRVLAAASLTDVVGDQLADDFEASNADVAVEPSFGSSTDLAEQAADGAPGDVLLTADETSMKVATDAGVASDPVEFATNKLVIVTPKGNPGGVESLDDLADVDWVRCADEVPCGRVAQAVLQRQGVTADPVSLEEDVRATLEKVVDGEVAAGLVYASDAVAAGSDVETIEIPGAEQDATSYFAAPLQQSEDADRASAFVDLLTSEDGQQALEDAGFGRP